jgi:hypothetical protein
MILPLDSQLVESSVRIGAGMAREYGNEWSRYISENLLICLQSASEIIINALILLVVMAAPTSVENKNSYCDLSSLSESF